MERYRENNEKSNKINHLKIINNYTLLILISFLHFFYKKLKMWSLHSNFKKDVPITGILFNQNGNLLAGYDSVNIIVWEYKTGKTLFSHTVLREKSKISPLPIAFQPITNLLAIGVDSAIELWDIYKNEKVDVLNNTSNGDVLEFNSNGSLLAREIKNNEMIHIFDMETKKIKYVTNSSKYHRFMDMKFISDTEILVNKSDGLCIINLENNNHLIISDEPSSSFAIHPNRKIIAFCKGIKDKDSCIRDSLILWDLELNKELSTLYNSSWINWSLTFNSNGNILVIDSYPEEVIKFYNIITEDRITSICTWAGSISKFHPIENVLVSCEISSNSNSDINIYKEIGKLTKKANR